MTRKKSNVKALALAVTCAILAGGGIGIEPVYAADVTYDVGSNQLKNGTTAIDTLTVGGVTIGGSGAITADSLALNGIGDVKTAIEGKAAQADVENNKNNIANLQTKTTKISYNATTGTTVEGAITATDNITANGGLSAANGRFTVKASGETVFNDETDLNKTTTIKAGETVVKGANGKVTINNSGINIAQKELGTNKDLSITLDSGYVDASGYVKAPKFIIDNDNGFVKEADGKSRLTVSDVDETGAVTNSVKIGGGNILASGDVNVAGTLCTNTILNATHGEGVTVDGVKFKAGAVSGISDINDGIIKFTKNGTKNIVQINSDLMFNDDAGQQAATLTLEGVKTLNGLSNGSSKIEAGNGSVVGGVTFNAGAVSDVKSINDKIKISADGKTVTFNEGEPKGQVEISEKGIKVGTGSTYISGDAVYTGGATYNDAKAGMMNDGSLKAAGGAFTVDTAGKVTTTGDIQGKDITATGALKGASLDVTGDISTNGSVTAKGGLNVANGNFTVDGTTGDTTVKGKLDVTGDITGQNITAKGALKGQTLGIGAANTEFVVDANGNITKVTSITADENKLSTIGGVKLEGKKVTADNLEIGNKITTKDLEVTGFFIVGDFTTSNLKVNNTLTVGTDTKLTDGELVLGTDAQHTLTKAKLKTINDTINDTGEITTKKAIIGGNTIIESTGITSNSVTATTGTIGGITLSGGSISGVTRVTAGEFYVDTDNNLNSSGITASKGTVGGVTIESKEVKANKFTAGASSLAAGNLEIDSQNSWTNAGIQANAINAGSATIGINTTINNIGISTNQVQLGDMTITDGNITDTNGVTINGVELKANAVTASEGFTVDAHNKLDANGLTAKAGTFVDSVTIGSSSTNQTKVEQGKITVKGPTGRSTAHGTVTTIDGGVITTDTLNVQRIELGEKLVDSITGSTITNSSIYLNNDGSFGAAKGAFQIDTDGQVTNKIIAAGTDASETTFTSSKTGITAKYRKGTGTATSGLTIEENHAALNASGGAALDLKDKTAKIGSGTDSLTTYTSDTIESKVGTGVTRVMTNSTTEQSIVDAVGAASRTLKADEIVDAVGTTTVTTNSNGTTFGNNTANNTLIYGSAITSTNGAATGVLNGSNLTLTNGANSTALTAGGATFTGAAGEKGSPTTTINGGTITTDTLNVDRINLGGEVIDKGAAGVETNSKLYMDAQGNFRAAEGNFTVKGGTGTDRGALHNNVGNTSFDTTETGASMKYNNGTVESNVSVGDNSAKISAGASFIEVKNDGITNNGVTTFNGTTGTTTKIDGGTITTNHLITDKLTITGSGNADGTGSTSGSIAFGGNGSITSNIKDATTGKEATFKTDEKGTFTEAKDNDGNKTTNTVNAKGNTNVVTDSTNTSTATQTATSIGGVVTNGTVTMRQELTADGVKVSVDGDTANYTQITNKDVSITDQKNPGKRINLSDLGQLNDLDGELTARDEYTNNKTAVGAINAEAGIRREEVARLDGRINDVNDRVNKVGAMAAAIASLKSIGYDPQAPSEFSIGLGQYKGETGVAMGFFHYPNKNFMINVSLSTAGGETMGGIGATWRFGHKSPQKLLEEQREAQAKKELAAAEKYQAAAKLAKEAQERAEYAAKLARQAQVSADNAKAAADATQAKHFG